MSSVNPMDVLAEQVRRGYNTEAPGMVGEANRKFQEFARSLLVTHADTTDPFSLRYMHQALDNIELAKDAYVKSRIPPKPAKA
jgi:hypothetical protein